MKPVLSSVLHLAAVLLIILWQPLLFMGDAAAQANQLTLGSSITPAQYLTSSSGIFALGFCNVAPSLDPHQLLLAVWFDFGASDCTNKTVVWFARDPTSNSPVIATKQSVLRLDSNSSLSLVDGHTTLWSPPISQPFGSALVILDSGNLQLQAARRNGVSWQSFDHPTHALLPGQNMTNSSGTYLLSKNTDTDFSPWRFALTVQADDNIVLYKRDPDSMNSLAGNSGHPYWSSRTWHSGQVPTLVLDNSGNLFYNDSVNGYRNLTMKQPLNSAASYYHYAALDPDGIVRVYAHRKNITDGTVWEVVSMFPSDGCSRMTNYSTQSMNCECPYGYVLVDEHGYKGCWPISVPAGPRARSIWLYIIIGILAISFGTSIAYNLWQRYTNKREKRSRLSAGLRIFSHKELERATDGFKVTLGKGGFGEVYKGEVSYLLVQYHVAVKKLIIKSDEIIEKDFENEVQSIGQIHHKYLVRMIGYCKEGVHRLLVFEYMQGGTLADFISRPERPCWSCLAGAAVGIAKGLEYLHEGCQSQIIHCDIKPENILFDDKDTPKITDFGIAKLLGDQKTHHTVTTVAGTRPYLAPEWFDGRGQVSSKVDVYSFGVMLLEMICCKRIADHGSVSDLRAWAESSIRSGRADLLVQGDGEAMANMGNVERFTRVAIWCLQKDPSSRPGMRKVVQMLEGTMVVDPLPDPPRPPSFSAVLPTSSRSSHSGSAVVHTLQVDY